MEDFLNYLQSKKIIPPKKLLYYCNWIKKFKSFSGSQASEQNDWKSVEAFLKLLARKYEDWQVEQAGEALKYYQYFLTHNPGTESANKLSENNSWKTLADEMVQLIRLKHLSRSTEKTYLN